jgi:hypothetical protein
MKRYAHPFAPEDILFDPRASRAAPPTARRNDCGRPHPALPFGAEAAQGRSTVPKSLRAPKPCQWTLTSVIGDRPVFNGSSSQFLA